MEDVQPELVVIFPDASASFVHGFEAGGIYRHLQQGVINTEYMVHVANRELMEQFAHVFQLDVELELTEVPGWMTVTFVKKARRLKLVR